MFEKYRREGKFPIGAWVAPTPKHELAPDRDNHVREEPYRLAKEMGLRFLICIYDIFPDFEEDCLNALKYAEQYGLDLIMRDRYQFYSATENDRFPESFAKYGNHKACLGVLVADEPAKNWFPELKKLQENFRKVAKDQVFYVNLLPVYAFPENFDEKGRVYPDEEIKNGLPYHRYVEEFVETVHPEFLSYDFYPLAYEFPNLNPMYFWQLSCFAQLSRRYGIPFGNFIAATTWNKDLRMPRREELFFQVTTSLAFGSKGIQYFTYDTPINGDVPEGERYETAILGPDAKPTERYYFVQELNRHLSRVGDCLIDAEHLGIFVQGETPVPIPEEGRRKVPFEISGKHLLVGCFQKEQEELYYLVNNSLTESDQAKIVLKSEQNVKMILGDAETEVLSKEIGICLPASEGVLLIFQKGVRPTEKR